MSAPLHRSIEQTRNVDSTPGGELPPQLLLLLERVKEALNGWEVRLSPWGAHIGPIFDVCQLGASGAAGECSARLLAWAVDVSVGSACASHACESPCAQTSLPGSPYILQADQVTVNEYTCGVGLSPHVDTHSAFSGPILSLSLAGPAVMVFRRDGEERGLALQPRALLIMADEARLAW